MVFPALAGIELGLSLGKDSCAVFPALAGIEFSKLLPAGRIAEIEL